jgi:hypothetical protein
MALLGKTQLAAVIAECGGPRPAKTARKAELVSEAAGLATGTGWLPAELRTPSYTGPGSNAWAEARAAAAIPQQAAE